VQLGELQHQIERFERRGVSVLAVSVDKPAASLAMIERLGLTFDLASDPDQAVIRAFRVQNPDTRELAIHAVYIVNREGIVFYRKVGLRRPVSQELIDAIDAYRGEYPRTDEAVQPRQRVAVAYPHNEFQALLTAAAVEKLPESVSQDGFRQVIALLRERRSDDALVAFKSLAAASSAASEQDLFDTAAWLTRVLYLEDTPESLDAGRLLRRRLDRLAELEAMLEATTNADERDQLQQTLARARAGLTMTRAEISNNASSWNLRRVKTTLRSYREVARAETRVRARS
jgi:hypothetical protein